MNQCLCTRPAGDAFACPACAASARDSLIDLARASSGLALTRDRQRATQFDASPRSSEKALPYDPRVQDVVDIVHNGIVGLAELVWQENPDADPESLGRNSGTPEIALWLTQFVGWMRFQKWCHEEWNYIERSVKRISAITDPPPERTYFGNCRHCEHAVMHTIPAPALIPCEECGEGNDRDELQETMLARIDGHLATIGEIIGLLRRAGQPVVTERAIQRRVAEHGLKPAARLTIMRKDGRTDQVDGYRVRDIRAMIEKATARRRSTA